MFFCAHCRVPFHPSKGLFAYCSEACARGYKLFEGRRCERCHILFTPQAQGPQRFCSAICRKSGPPATRRGHVDTTSNRIFKDKPCADCKLLFTPRTGNQKVCSTCLTANAPARRKRAKMVKRLRLARES